MRYLRFVIMILCIGITQISASVVVQGTAKLYQQSDHSNIKVHLVALSPSAVEDSIYTDYTGDWSISIAVGRYTIVFSHDGYEDRVIEPTLFDSDTTLPEIILQPSLGTISLSGYVSGTLQTGYTYIADSTITINSEDSLIIEPGVKIKFGELAGMNVYGYLEAVGTDLDFIRFTTMSGAQARGSIIFWQGSDSTSVMKYCVVEKGQGTTDAVENIWGGGITLHYTNATVEHCIIRDNYAQYGGGIYIEQCAPKIRYNTISTNSATDYGGGVYYNQYCSGVLHNNAVENNSVTQGDGGGVCVRYYSNPEISGNLISGNIASNYGGGLLVKSSSFSSIINNLISINSSSYGGGLMLQNSSPHIEGNDVVGNITSSYGSGMYLYSSSSPQITDNLIADNSGGEAAVHIYNYSDPVFSDNIVMGNGNNTHGAIRVEYHCSPWIVRNLFYNNNGDLAGSMRITGSSTPTIRLNSFVLNNPNYGNAAEIDIWKNSSPLINSNIIALGSSSEGIYFEPGGVGQPQIEYNDVYGYTTPFENCPDGVGEMVAANANGDISDIYNNISMDPLFFNSDSANFNLLASSPCINAGDPDLPLDPDSTVADMGAYPYNTQEGYQPFISITVRQHHFTNIEVAHSDTFMLPVRNIGTADLLIQSAVSSDTHFVVIDDSIVVSPDSLVHLPIIFTPDSVGQFQGTVTVNSNAVNEPTVVINVSGTGITTPDFWVATPLGYQVRVGQSGVNVPVLISDVDGMDIVSYNVTIGYDSSIVTAQPISVTGTMSDGWSVATNIELDRVIIGAAGTMALTGEGTLFNLVFDVKTGLPDSTVMYLPFEEAVFNDGTITPATATGYIQVENIVYGDVDDNSAIQAYDAALTLQYSVNLDPIPDVDPRPWETWRIRRADVDGNHTIQAYDASLILQFVVGLIDTFPVEYDEDRSGLPESHFTIVQEGSELQFHIDESSLLYGCNLELTYDSSSVTFSGTEQTALSDSYIMYTNESLSGVLSIGLMSAQPADRGGIFLTLPFDLNGETILEVCEVINAQDTLIHQVELDLLSSASDLPQLPNENRLEGNYPNPFNSETRVRYAVAEENARVVLVIYDIMGKVIRKVETRNEHPGYYSLVWDGTTDRGDRVASGIYLYRLTIGDTFNAAERILLLK